MTTGEGSAVPPERSHRLKCPKCGQILMKSSSGVCLWCGAELPEELRLTSEEKTGIHEQPKSSRRARCTKCRQVLTKSLFDRCVWCGAELPEELRLTSEEKARFREQQKADLNDMETDRRKKELEADIYSHDWSLKGAIK